MSTPIAMVGVETPLLEMSMLSTLLLFSGFCSSVSTKAPLSGDSPTPILGSPAPKMQAMSKNTSLAYSTGPPQAVSSHLFLAITQKQPTANVIPHSQLHSYILHCTKTWVSHRNLHFNTSTNSNVVCTNPVFRTWPWQCPVTQP